MPIKRCRKNGKPGFKFGDKGTCYTYTPHDAAGSSRANRKAATQGRAENDRSNPEVFAPLRISKAEIMRGLVEEE